MIHFNDSLLRLSPKTLFKNDLLWIVRPPVDSAKWISGGASRLNLDLQTEDLKTFETTDFGCKDGSWWERLVRTSAKPMSSNWFGLNRISCKMLVGDTAHGTHYTQHAHYSGCPLRRATHLPHAHYTACAHLHRTSPSLSVGLIRVWVVWCVFAEKKLFSQLNFNWIWTVAASQKQEAAGNERHREGSKVLWSLVRSCEVWWSLMKSGATGNQTIGITQHPVVRYLAHFDYRANQAHWSFQVASFKLNWFKLNNLI